MWPLFLTSLVAGWAPVVPPSVTCLVDLLSLFSSLVQSPFGIFAFSESLPEMVLSLLEQLRLATHCGGPMGEGVDYTQFGWEVMVTVHCKYWSVWVGLLYTVMDSVPSASGLTMVSKKGMDPSSLLSSTVSLMAGSTLFMCRRKPCLLTSLWHLQISILSDLEKTTAVVESLSTTSTRCSVTEITRLLQQI